MGKTQLVDIDLIRIDGGTQARVITNLDVVADYAEHYRDETPGGPTLPPVDVFWDGTDYWLGDGFHRRHAAAQAGLAKLDCIVHAGTKRDAILFAVQANHSHGLKRTNKDKRKAVEMLLADAEWSQQSDRWIADMAGVSNQTVSNTRAEVSKVDTSTKPATRKGKDGKQYPAKPKAAARSTKAAKPEPPPKTVDACKNEIPDHLQRVASNPFLKESIDALNRMVRAVTDFGNGPGGYFLLVKDTVGGLTQARNAMVNAQFHCVCPECGGKGCGTCRKAGFLPEWRLMEIEAAS
jgi:hypothetical protein